MRPQALRAFAAPICGELSAPMHPLLSPAGLRSLFGRSRCIHAFDLVALRLSHLSIRERCAWRPVKQRLLRGRCCE